MMHKSHPILNQLVHFPPALRLIVEDELRAGNEVTDISNTSPAPVDGLCVRLAKPIRTHPRASAPCVDFVERVGTSHSGEFSDHSRRFFVIDPPHTPTTFPDMNAIRAAIDGRERASLADRFKPDGGLW